MKDNVNKNPKGKLYEYAKYYNSMRSLKTCGLVPIKEPTVKTLSNSRHDIELGRDKFVFKYYSSYSFSFYFKMPILHQAMK